MKVGVTHKWTVKLCIQPYVMAIYNDNLYDVCKQTAQPATNYIILYIYFMKNEKFKFFKYEKSLLFL